MQNLHTTAILISSMLALTAGLATGIESRSTGVSEDQQLQQDDPRTVTLARLSKRIEADFVDQTAQDVFDYIAEITGADLLISYESDIDPDGIDPEALITFKAKNQGAITVIDRLIRTLNSTLQPSTDYAWQLTEDGAFQIGPKDALDRDTRTVIYDIGDLLFEIPNFTNAPDFQLQSSSGGSGGGTAPFTSTGGNNDDRLSAQDKIDNLIQVITTIVEPEAWIIAGGSSATITTYQSTLIVSAPDYVHRALGGYDFWPSSLQSKQYKDGQQQTIIRPKPQRPKGP